MALLFSPGIFVLIGSFLIVHGNGKNGDMHYDPPLSLVNDNSIKGSNLLEMSLSRECQPQAYAYARTARLGKAFG
jgi:hypothetical protein